MGNLNGDLTSGRRKAFLAGGLGLSGEALRKFLADRRANRVGSSVAAYPERPTTDEETRAAAHRGLHRRLPPEEAYACVLALGVEDLSCEVCAPLLAADAETQAYMNRGPLSMHELSGRAPKVYKEEWQAERRRRERKAAA